MAQSRPREKQSAARRANRAAYIQRKREEKNVLREEKKARRDLDGPVNVPRSPSLASAALAPALPSASASASASPSAAPADPPADPPAHPPANPPAHPPAHPLANPLADPPSPPVYNPQPWILDGFDTQNHYDSQASIGHTSSFGQYEANQEFHRFGQWPVDQPAFMLADSPTPPSEATASRECAYSIVGDNTSERSISVEPSSLSGLSSKNSASNQPQNNTLSLFSSLGSNNQHQQTGDLFCKGTNNYFMQLFNNSQQQQQPPNNTPQPPQANTAPISSNQQLLVLKHVRPLRNGRLRQIDSTAEQVLLIFQRYSSSHGADLATSRQFVLEEFQKVVAPIGIRRRAPLVLHITYDLVVTVKTRNRYQ
ncbi:MAG: hypothetical protein Q9167_006126 [Letrouitia subvulpina]